MSKSTRKIILAIGLPGAGKSTYFARRGIVPLSSDLIRQLIYDDATDQRRPDWVFTALRELLRRRLASGAHTSYIDATNLTRRNRRGFLDVAREFGCEAEALYFNVPLEVCLDRNRARANQGASGSWQETPRPGGGPPTLVTEAIGAAAIPPDPKAPKDRVVPEAVLRRMAEELEPPSREEGFKRIRTVRGKIAPGTPGRPKTKTATPRKRAPTADRKTN